MRQIKFRQAITDTEGHFEWRYWGYLHTDTAGLPVFINPLGPVEWDKRESYQFTGLCDKNSKEIYGESDIYKDANGVISVVKMAVDRWALFPVKKGTPVRNLYWQNVCDKTKGEVIGNIHENPELLEK